MRDLCFNISIPKQHFIVLLFLLISCGLYANESSLSTVKQEHLHPEMSSAKIATSLDFFSVTNTLSLKTVSKDSIAIFKNKALEHASAGDVDEAIYFITKYMGATADMSIVNDHIFSNISEHDTYKLFKKTYAFHLEPITILYLYAGFLGLFVFVVLCLKKVKDRVATFLMGLFVLFHSIFILHLTIHINNVVFYIPHSLYISTTFSFLYGPLLYFYFKRTSFNYKFRWRDTLHFLPSIALIVYMLPFYVMSDIDKFNVILNQKNWMLPGTYAIIVVKVLSLSIYAYLIIRMHQKSKGNQTCKNAVKFCWQRNLITLHIIYVAAYVVYAAYITKIITYAPLYHLQILVMVAVVFYVSYIVYEQPEIFKGNVKLVDPIQIFKYKKSGLTPSYSHELKEALLGLFNDEKIYKNNNLSLEFLSERLGTTRHNTSQVINEHFDMNFFELVNTYRINEAKDILKDDRNNNLTIIQVAYEVGFNNKVTFNKSFKKQLSLTPSQFIKSLRV